MKGTRPLSDAEISLVLLELRSPRDRALFTLGIRSGFRISELLSLNVEDVYQYDKVIDRVTVKRRHMKKKVESRSVVLHPEAKASLEDLIKTLDRPEGPLFRSVRGALTRSGAWRMLRQVFDRLQLTGQLGTHAMRKTFANKVYQALGKDLLRTQKALGHRNLDNTAKYLSFAEEEVDACIRNLN